MKTDAREEIWTKNGYDAYLKAPDAFPEICESETKKFARKCEAERTALTYQGQIRSHEEKIITDSLRAGGGVPPMQTVQAECKRGYSELILALLLLTSSFALVYWSLQPYENLGWKMPLIALGWSVLLTTSFALVLWILVKVLPERAVLIWKLFLVISAAVFAAVTIMGASHIRGDLAAIEIIQKNGTDISELVKKFYEETLKILRTVFPFVAISIDITAAVLLDSATTKLTTQRPVLKMLKRLEQLRSEMADIASGIKDLEVAPEIFEACFRRGGKEAEEKMKKNREIEKARTTDPESDRAKKLTMAIIIYAAVLLLIIILYGRAFGSECVIVHTDVTLSSNARDYSENLEFDKNFKGVEKVIQHLKPGTEINIFGITGDSFSRPFLIMQGKVRNEAGYFGQYLQADQKLLLEKWEKATQNLRPRAKETDMVGALFLSATVLSSCKGDKKIAVFFSDMRHSIGVNLEKQEIVDLKMIDKVIKLYGVPDLRGVQIYVYGAHAGGKSIAYWTSLKLFWEQYLQLSGAELKTYSPIREVNYE